jgi:hypothetical protein
MRHQGAISIVVPYFAEGVTASNFLEKSACFRLSANNEWRLLSRLSVSESVLVMP